MLDWHRVTRRCVGFEGGEPLNITFTMARPLPIYPLKVPSYLFTHVRNHVHPLGLRRGLGEAPPLFATSGHSGSVHRRPHYIRGGPLFFFLFGERLAGPASLLLRLKVNAS